MNKLTLVALSAACATTGCSSSSDTAESVTATPPPTMAAPVTNCVDAPASAVARIENTFNEPGRTLAYPQAVAAPGGVTYVSGNIMDGDKRISAMVVWATKSGGVYSISSSAQTASALPDGRTLLKANAGDAYGSAVQKCVLDATRAGK